MATSQNLESDNSKKMACCKGTRITKFALTELQGLVAFLADDHIHKQETMNDNQRMLKMQKFFHGDAK